MTMEEQMAELKEQLVITRSAMQAAMRLLYAWKDKYRMEHELEQTEKDIVETEHELFMQLREVRAYDGDETAAPDPQAEPGT